MPPVTSFLAIARGFTRLFSSRYVELAKATNELSGISVGCCGGGCVNCVWIANIEKVLGMADKFGMKKALELIDEYVENPGLKAYLKLRVRLKHEAKEAKASS